MNGSVVACKMVRFRTRVWKVEHSWRAAGARECGGGVEWCGGEEGCGGVVGGDLLFSPIVHSFQFHFQATFVHPPETYQTTTHKTTIHAGSGKRY